jgi:polyisoprenoid-binding protein YceI
MPVTTTTPGMQRRPAAQPHLAGAWRLDPVHSQAWFAARVAGRLVRGQMPLTGRVHIAQPAEESAARLDARASAVSTGSPVLDRLLAGPGFLDAGAFPDISFRSDLLVQVPAGWRAIGRLRVKNVEHELACQLMLDPDLPGPRPGGPPRLTITSSWVIDSRWVTSQRVPGLGRRIVMRCSFSLDPVT